MLWNLGLSPLCGDAWLSGPVVPGLAVPCCPQAGCPEQAKSAPCSPASPSTAKGLLSIPHKSLTKDKLRQVPKCRVSPKLQSKGSYFKCPKKATQEGEWGVEQCSAVPGLGRSQRNVSPKLLGFVLRINPSSDHPRWMKGMLWQCCPQLEAARSLQHPSDVPLPLLSTALRCQTRQREKTHTKNPPQALCLWCTNPPSTLNSTLVPALLASALRGSRLQLRVLGFKLAELHVLRKLSMRTGSPELLPESLRVELKLKHPSCTAQEKPSALLEASCCCDHHHTPVQKPSHALSFSEIPGIHPKWVLKHRAFLTACMGTASPSHIGTTSSHK